MKNLLTNVSSANAIKTKVLLCRTTKENPPCFAQVFHSFMLSQFFSWVSTQDVHAAGATIVPLTIKDYDLIETGAACTLTSKANENYLYDNLSKGLIRYDGKAYVLERVQGDWDQGFYECGQSYSYVSENGQIKINVDMTKAKKKKGPCSGSLAVTGQEKNHHQ